MMLYLSAENALLMQLPEDGRERVNGGVPEAGCARRWGAQGLKVGAYTYQIRNK